MAHQTVRTKDVVGVVVKNHQEEKLGKIEEIVLEKFPGRVAYVVLAAGGFLGIGEKFFAIPWNAIHFNPEEDCFILNIDTERLKNAPGFDKDNWPDMSDRQWAQSIFVFYGTKPYWED